MKRKNKLTLSLLLSFVLLLYPLIITTPVSAIPAPLNPFEITDANLKAVVLKTLHDDYGIDEITEESVKKITSLKASSQDIESLRGLEYFYNLKEVDLSNNKLSNVGELGHLGNLSAVNLDNNNITKMYSISTEKLSLRNNKIADISYMYDSYRIQDLDLRDNKLSDVSVLAKFKDLKHVKLENQKPDLGETTMSGNFKLNNTIKDNNNMPVTQLTNISNNGVFDANTNLISWENINKDTTVTFDFSEKITIAGSDTTFNGTASKTLKYDASLGDYVPVNIPDENFKTTILRTLEVPEDHVITKHDMESITEISGLCNGTKDITGIEYCTNLKKAYFGYHNHGVDFSPISGLKNLEILEICDSDLTSIYFLENLTNLKLLVLDENNISNPAPLKGLTNLEYLSINNCNLTYLDSLASLTNLETLNLSNNRISDIKPLSSLTKLTKLNLSNNKISDISPLANLTTLEDLNMNDNQITNLSPLSNINIKAEDMHMVSQKLTLPETKSGQSLTLRNLPVYYDNTPVIPKSISNDGVYDAETNTITWDNLTSDTKNLTLTYSDYKPHDDPDIPKQPDIPQPDGDSKVPVYKIPTGYSSTITIPIDVKDEYQAVNIPDKALRHEILQTLNRKDNYTINKEDMESITELRCTAYNYTKVKDLTGLEFCTNLKSLDLVDNDVSDLSPLKDLTNLTELYMYNNKITDITSLENLTNLTRLTISKNKIKDINVLSSLTNLTTLTLSNISISDITPLQNLNNLTDINLEGNEITDIATLENLTNLTDLVLGSNKITDITPLKNLTNLIYLNFSRNDVQDITPLSELTKLAYLEASNNGFSDITPLANLTKLIELDLSYNKINDISPLASLSNLNELYLSNNEISKIPNLSKLSQLENLNASYNEINNISGLAKLESLKYLSLTNNKISDISALRELYNIKNFELTSNEITDLSPIKAFTHLANAIHFKRQEVKMDEKQSNGSLTITNPVTDFNGSGLAPLKISNNGVYDNETNTITWTELPEGTTNLTLYYNLWDNEYDSNENNGKPSIPGIPEGYSANITIPVNVKTSDDTSVYIPDSNLKNAICKELGKTTDADITKKDMKSITSLNLADKKIKNLDGLQTCTNLKEIDLSNNRISNIAPLAQIKNLELAELSNNRINDISCLRDASNKMTHFNIDNQYVVLAPDTCKYGSYCIYNAISDIVKVKPTEISNGGSYSDNNNSIIWSNLVKNTTVSYSYEIVIDADEAEKLNTPVIKYSCKVNQYLKVLKKN